MSKEDVADMPAQPPHKRRSLRAVPDVWLAVWAGSEILTPAEQRRVQEERERRKAQGVAQTRVAIVKGEEGMTPAQRRAILSAVPTGALVRHWQLSGGAEDLYREALNREVDLMIAAPREMTMPNNVPTWERSPVWAAIAYAKNRRIPVKIILPNGEEGHFD
jgi:hypothetical protein